MMPRRDGFPKSSFGSPGVRRSEFALQHHEVLLPDRRSPVSTGRHSDRWQHPGAELKRTDEEAFVLRTQDLGEADLIVTLLAKRHGKVRGVARSAKRSRRRFGGRLEPMTRVRATWSEKEGRDLHRIEALDSIRSFAAMQADPQRQAVCAVLSELSDAFSREGQGEEREFKLLGAVLDALDQGLDSWIAVRYFESWTLRLHGLFPDLTLCGSCSEPVAAADSLWVGAAGETRCRKCERACAEPGRRLTAADRSFLASSSTLPPLRMPSDRVPVLPGGALEALMRGTLQSFAERRFRTYRHLTAATDSPAGGSLGR